MASAYLSKNLPANQNSLHKWTYSGWIKRCDLGNTTHLFNFYDDDNNRGGLRFNSDDTILYYERKSGSTIINKTTNRVFRDVSAWYHIMVAVDKSVSSPDTQIYINGVEETSFSTDNDYSQNQTTKINDTDTLYINSENGSTNIHNQLMTHVHWVSGYKLTPATFGETDSTSGIWKPKTAPSVTYGTNGFFLKFENSGAMGTDSSGNGNNFTVSGTLTQSVDTPSNNFATGNPLYFTNSAWTTSLSNGNLTVTGHSGTNSYPVLASTLAVSAGKFYAEFKVTSSSQNFYCGVATPEAVSGTSINAHYPNWNNEGGSNAHAYSIYGADGLKYVKENGGSTASSSYAGTTSQNDIIGIALDLDNNKLYFHKNGTYFNSGVPTSGSTGTGAISIINHDYLFFFSDGGGSTDASGQANFGSGYFGTTAISSAGTAPSEGGIFEYDCPSGYQALCTKGINSF